MNTSPNRVFRIVFAFLGMIALAASLGWAQGQGRFPFDARYLYQRVDYDIFESLADPTTAFN